jgi:NAD-dependent deacetylase
VIRLHGSLWRNRCDRCGREREDDSLAYPELPRSPCCGALERPGVVWFGERLPPEALAAAERAAAEADAVLVVGTSGVVHPAAGLVAIARHHGARVVDVNPEASALASDLALRLPAGEALPALFAAG